MQLLSFLSLAAAFASVTAAQRDLPPRPDLKYDETADWYKDHGKPIPDVAPEITVIEANRSYVVKLECPDCPFLVKEGRKASWQERDNSLLLKFDLKDAVSDISIMRLNGATVLPLDPMPLHINAYQVAGNLTHEAMDSIIHERLLDPDFAWQTRYHQFPLQYEHTLLKTETPGQWWMQFDITGFPWGKDGEPVHFDEDRRLVQVLVKEEKLADGAEKSLSIKDVQIVERYQRAQPIRMKCGKLAMVKTAFDPNEWDEYGKLGSWSRVWNMVFGKIGQYWLDHIQHNALLLPLALLLAFLIFFARVWHQRGQQEKAMDAEYALLESTQEGLPPAYSDIPVIKIEEYD
ncbi:hypothetical protein BU25DRAFT_435166 [Macroventuria anomochaeta]|uniref:Uncharacterized protein n=1 Tax=Macroventuria anomochaeta TaxID=301207 RepID=A0ACB6RJN2_9PLEO|nr:uncharacterized protein BU25DRAFT_435166 [Macroventuria anomochaeta]KAF2621943.1 hypothetical protein BU25DRAFT_435166 [Macroventuria anomochaeta]